MKQYLFIVFLTVLSWNITATETENVTQDEVDVRYPFTSKEKETLFLELSRELRCPKCLNQNIADSKAGVAMDLKNKTYQLVQEGKDKEFVVEYMVKRYGNFVTYQPPVNAVTIWLWLLPLLIAVALIFIALKRTQAVKPNSKKTSEDALHKAKALLNANEKSNSLAKGNDHD